MASDDPRPRPGRNGRDVRDGPAGPRRAPAARTVRVTREFERWSDTLGPDQRARLTASLRRIAEVGPTLGRPEVDRIQGSRMHKLKEARIDRGTRVLFAFDSHRDPVMLVGGDKTGEWSGWYPRHVKVAERLYLHHERQIGKEPGCLSRHDAGRTSSPRSR
jgi:hypothetical protein